MSDKRYFKIEYDEEWYLFDSTTISEQLVKEQAEYGYGVFANSLSPSEVVDLLNELITKCSQLEKENEKLRWDLNKTREDLDFFANLKVTAMKGSEPMEDGDSV